jgi:hypothetical protein
LQRASASRIARRRGLHRASAQLTLCISAFNIAHPRVMCRASAHSAWRIRQLSSHRASTNRASRIARLCALPIAARLLSRISEWCIAHPRRVPASTIGVVHAQQSSRIVSHAARVANRSVSCIANKRIAFRRRVSVSLILEHCTWCVAHSACRITQCTSSRFALRVSASGVARQ